MHVEDSAQYLQFPDRLLISNSASSTMAKANIIQVLNDSFGCTRCHSSHGWIAAAPPAIRQYSTIHRLECAHCSEKIVAKVIGGRYSSEAARAHARKEYQALCKLQVSFPQDERYGTLVPLGHLEHDGCGVVITRLADGVDLTHCIRSGGTRARAACNSAGVWLRKLHESDARDQKKHVGAADKVSFLVDTYGAELCNDGKTSAAFETFVEAGTAVDEVAVPAVRQHGDFKPDNLLCHGTKYVGLDIHWRSIGAAVYDLAPFLNHLWLHQRLAGTHIARRYDLYESAFLSGYGYGGEMRTLRWAQLYFALCYMGEYRARGQLIAKYARWKAWPLVRRLAMQVRDAI